MAGIGLSALVVLQGIYQIVHVGNFPRFNILEFGRDVAEILQMLHQ